MVDFHLSLCLARTCGMVIWAFPASVSEGGFTGIEHSEDLSLRNTEAY